MITGANELRRRISRIERHLRSGALLRGAGIVVLRHSRAAFDQARDPWTGASWAPLAASSKLRRRKGPLNVTGRLRRSLNIGDRGSIFRVTPREVQVGTSDVAAPFQQLGTRPHTIKAKGKALAFQGAGGKIFARSVKHPGIKVRRILGVSRKATREIEIIMAKDVEREMGK